MWINKSYLEARRKAKIKQRIIILELSHWAQRVGVQRAEFISSYAECIIYYNFLANIHIFVKSMLNMNHAASRHLLARQWNCGFCTFDVKMGRAESESEVANLFIILVNFHIFIKPLIKDPIQSVMQIKVSLTSSITSTPRPPDNYNKGLWMRIC